ncbi:MAG TPA: hypothetical protein VER39_06095 [Nocardioidaceae bacterium]|nr:hypothetical protein [Nocardioidaceae bacterium]
MSTQQQSVPVSGILGLQFFVGEWEASGTFFATPFSTQKRIRMSIEVVPVLSGSWIRTDTAEEVTVDNPTPLLASYLWGTDAATGELVAYWFDSSGGHAQQTSSGWSRDRLVFTGTMTNGGITFPLRDTFLRVGPDAYQHLGEVDLGQGWIPVDEESVRRR